MEDESRNYEELEQDLERARQRIEELEGELKSRSDTDERCRLLTTAVEAATEGLGLVDTDGKLLFVNAAFADMHGLSPDEMVGSDISSCYTDSDREAADSAHKTALESGSHSAEIRHQRTDGTVFPCLEQRRVFPDGGEQPRGCVVAVRDISARRKAEQESWESEYRYREIVQSANSIILRWTPEGIVTFCNQFARRFFGYSEDEIVGKSIIGTIVPKTDSGGHDLAAIIRRIEERPELYASHENENMRKNGERVWISWTNKAIVDENGKITEILSVGNDVTDRRRVEQELLQAKKLESLGILAGGIAHDFNNILTEVFANIGSAKVYLDLARNMFERLNEAEKASFRAKKLTAELLTFSKRLEPVKQVESVASLIEDSATFVLRGSNVVCDFALQDDLWPVRFDEEMILQVLSTLIINAQQAMPDGGEVRIGAENVEIGIGDDVPVRSGKYIRITVADRGVGIPADLLPRIFDPYFTTKKERTGLGLAAAYSVIKKHKGHISVESEVGVGTTFTIHLPAETEKADAEDRPPRAVNAHKPRVLVLDEDEISRTAAGEFLSILGCEPSFAAEPGEAMRVYESALENGKPFDVVIVDYSMTESGANRGMLGRLLELYPDLNAVISGASTEQAIPGLENFDFTASVEKPYNIHSLSLALSKFLHT